LRTGIAYAEYKVAVEVDQTDPEAAGGMGGDRPRARAHHIDTEAERAAIADLGLESWVEGETRALYSGVSPQPNRRANRIRPGMMPAMLCMIIISGAR